MRAVLIGLCLMACVAGPAHAQLMAPDDPRLAFPEPDVTVYKDKLRSLYAGQGPLTLEICVNQVLASAGFMEARQRFGDMKAPQAQMIELFTEGMVKRIRTDAMDQSEVEFFRAYYRTLLDMAYAYPALVLPAKLSGESARVAGLRMEKVQTLYAAAVAEPCIDTLYVKRDR